jgi:hypothetical protein
MRILEIGPAFAPLAPRSEGWDVCVVDHVTRAELVEQYAGPLHAVDTGRIEEVDVVWQGGPLNEAIPGERHGFDVCLASHVIEHAGDFVGFVQGVMGVLAPDGWLSLAVPDLRYCFDLLESPTRVGEIVAAHLRGSSRHRLESLYDQAAYTVRSNGSIAWGQEGVGAIELDSTFDAARQVVASWSDAPVPESVDCHTWQFTPASFQLAILELAALGLLDVHVASSRDTVGCEFFVTLRRGARVPDDVGELDARRLELLRRSAVEVGSVWATVGA